MSELSLRVRKFYLQELKEDALKRQDYEAAHDFKDHLKKLEPQPRGFIVRRAGYSNTSSGFSA